MNPLPIIFLLIGYLLASIDQFRHDVLGLAIVLGLTWLLMVFAAVFMMWERR